MALTIYEKAILDTIAYAEGTLGISNNGYDVIVGFPTIVGWSTNTSIVHGCIKPTSNYPNSVITEKGAKTCPDNSVPKGGAGTSWSRCVNQGCGITSTAAGRYQFLGSTWASITEKNGLGYNAPMTAENQDKMGIYLVKTTRNVTDSELESGIKSLENFKKIVEKIKTEWTSFKLDQPNNKKSPKHYWDVYKYAVDVYKKGGIGAPSTTNTSSNGNGTSNLVNSNTVIFVGGLDHRTGDLNLADQTVLLEGGLGSGINVFSFRHNNSTEALDKINTTSNPYVVLFSAGAGKSKKFAQKLIDKQYSLGGLYIVEPYGSGANTKSSVIGAVSLGTPNANVFVGNTEATGKGIVNGATPSDCNSPFKSHWCALDVVGKKIKADRDSFIT